MRMHASVRGDMVTFATLMSQTNPAALRLRMMAAAAIRIRQAFAENFAEGGRPEWAPLATSTQVRKMAMYLAGKLRGRNVRVHLVAMRNTQPKAPGALFKLVRTGRLRNSVVRSKTAGNISRIDAATGTIELGTAVPYGIFHEEGTKNMPARPFLTVLESDWDDVMAIMADMLENPNAYAPIGTDT